MRRKAVDRHSFLCAAPIRCAFRIARKNVGKPGIIALRSALAPESRSDKRRKISAAGTREATSSTEANRTVRSGARTNTAGLAIPPFSRGLKIPHSGTTRRCESDRIGNGSRNSRRADSDFSGASTETATTFAPAARNDGYKSRYSANWRRQKGHQWPR